MNPTVHRHKNQDSLGNTGVQRYPAPPSPGESPFPEGRGILPLGPPGRKSPIRPKKVKKEKCPFFAANLLRLLFCPASFSISRRKKQDHRESYPRARIIQ